MTGRLTERKGGNQRIREREREAHTHTYTHRDRHRNGKTDMQIGT